MTIDSALAIATIALSLATVALIVDSIVINWQTRRMRKGDRE